MRAVPLNLIGNPIAIITAGTSLPFAFDRDSEDPTGWTCTIRVVERAGDTPLIERVIPLDAESKWTGELTSTETASLASPANYRLVAHITKATTDEQETSITRFRVTDSWV